MLLSPLWDLTEMTFRNNFQHYIAFLSLPLIVFLSASVLSLQKNSSHVLAYFMIMIFSVFWAIFPLKISKRVFVKIILSVILSIFLYAPLFWHTVNMELWGDEINVIKISEYDFEQIARLVSGSHMAVPPLDYWLMHFWQTIVAVFPIEYHEFVYRFPYMIMHVLAASIFAHLLTSFAAQNKNEWEEILIYLLSFATYLVNPVLFAYSIEVRFYAFAALGSVVALYFFVNKHALVTRRFPLLLVFCLNSAFQFIVLIPYIIYEFIFRPTHRLKTAILLMSLSILFIFIYPSLLLGQGIGSEESIRLIIAATRSFWLLQFDSPMQMVGAIAMWLVAARQRSIHLFFVVLLTYLTSIIVMAYAKQYFDFHVRHFVIAVPVMLFILLSPLAWSRGASRIFLILAITMLFTIPWIKQMSYSVIRHKLFSKTLIGSKKLITLAEDKSADIIIAPNLGTPLPQGVYTFFAESVQWYVETYSSVKVTSAQTNDELCQAFNKNTRVIVYSLTGSIDCLSSDTIIDHLYGSIVYYPL